MHQNNIVIVLYTHVHAYTYLYTHICIHISSSMKACSYFMAWNAIELAGYQIFALLKRALATTEHSGGVATHLFKYLTLYFDI